MKEIRLAFKDIARNKIDYLFLFWQLIYFAGIIVFVVSDESLIVNLFICILFLIYKKRKVDKKLLIILLVVCFINFVSIAYTNYFNITFLVGFCIRLTTAYLIIKAFGRIFIERFENMIFILALISLPLYLIQIITPSFFNIFESISFATPTRANAGHINIFVYHYNAWAVFRNSGFMWEPAAFGAVLAWALIINIYKTSFVFNFRMLVFCVAMITTFSLGTYTYLAVFIFAFLLEKKLKKALIVYIFILTTFFVLSNLTFMGDQFFYMYEKYELYESTTSIQEGKAASVNNISRTQGFLLDIDYFLNWPLGYGWYRNDTDLINMAGSPNGFTRFIIIWGIMGLVFLITSNLRYLKILKAYFNSKIKYNIVYLVIFILTLNGNPIDQKPFFLAFVVVGFILYKRYRLLIKVHNKVFINNYLYRRYKNI